MRSFLSRHQSEVTGVLSGFDRLRLRGTLRLIANGEGLAKWLSYRKITLKPFKDYAMGITQMIRQATQRLADETERPVHDLASSSQRKEDVARQIAERDGITRGLVCILTCVDLTCVEPFKTLTVGPNRHQKKLELRSFLGESEAKFVRSGSQIADISADTSRFGDAELRNLDRSQPEWVFQRAVSQQSNMRYLEALAAVDTDATLAEVTADVCRRTALKGRSVCALSPLAADDARLLEAITRGEFSLHGFRNRDLWRHVFDNSSALADKPLMARTTRPLRAHGLVRKVSPTHRYAVTAKGPATATTLPATRQANARKLSERAAKTHARRQPLKHLSYGFRPREAEPQPNPRTEAKNHGTRGRKAELLASTRNFVRRIRG